MKKKKIIYSDKSFLQVCINARLEVSNCDNYFYYVCLRGDNEGLIEALAVLDGRAVLK